LEQRNPVDALKGDPDGFRHIVAEEEESIRFYEHLATYAADEGVKRLLDKLVEQEKRHLNIVQNIFDFVESPRTYLAWGEFSNLQEY
jgi:rubrerythrin